MTAANGGLKRKIIKTLADQQKEAKPRGKPIKKKRSTSISLYCFAFIEKTVTGSVAVMSCTRINDDKRVD